MTTDREAALRAVVEAARGKMSDTEWSIAGREPLTAYRIYADAVLAAGFSRTSQPVQVEVTDDTDRAKLIADARKYGPESMSSALIRKLADALEAALGEDTKEKKNA